MKFFGDKGSWGFIVPDNGGSDLFVHISAVGAAGLRKFEAGERIEYEIEIDERSKRPCAANLKMID